MSKEKKVKPKTMEELVKKLEEELKDEECSKEEFDEALEKMLNVKSKAQHPSEED